MVGFGGFGKGWGGDDVGFLISFLEKRRKKKVNEIDYCRITDSGEGYDYYDYYVFVENSKQSCTFGWL